MDKNLYLIIFVLLILYVCIIQNYKIYNYIGILLILILFLRFFLYNQIIDVFPTKKCYLKDVNNSYLWIRMNYNGNKLNNYKKWCNLLLLSGKNILGIYNPDRNLSINDVKKDIEIYKNCFGYNPKYYRLKYNCDQRIKNFLNSLNINIINNFIFDFTRYTLHC